MAVDERSRPSCAMRRARRTGHQHVADRVQGDGDPQSPNFRSPSCSEGFGSLLPMLEGHEPLALALLNEATQAWIED